MQRQASGARPIVRRWPHWPGLTVMCCAQAYGSACSLLPLRCSVLLLAALAAQANPLYASDMDKLNVAPGSRVYMCMGSWQHHSCLVPARMLCMYGGPSSCFICF